MDPANKGDRPRRGIVLSGGGARGAYEVGVLRYLCEHIKEVPLFDVITGTSVGAINGAYLASTSDRPRAAGRLMARMWATLTLDEFYKFGWTQVRMLPRVLFGKNLPKLTHGAVVGGLLDSSCVEEIVRDKIRWRGITDNLYRGVLDAVSCSATELATGINTVFVQTASGRLPRPWPRDPGQTVVLTALAAAHTLASAALPLLFPAVRVGDQLYVDGSMRQNTPVTPALRLGASRLLVISLRHEEEIPAATRRKRESARAVYPNALFMLGKMFNALMLDKLEADLHRSRRTNGKMAFDCIQRTRLHHYEGVMARWLRRLVLSAQEAAESDLASYVLFDPEYITQLIELGYQDAARQRDELKSLFE
jgi:NTE family protein